MPPATDSFPARPHSPNPPPLPPNAPLSAPSPPHPPHGSKLATGMWCPSPPLYPSTVRIDLSTCSIDMVELLSSLFFFATQTFSVFVRLRRGMSRQISRFSCVQEMRFSQLTMRRFLTTANLYSEFYSRHQALLRSDKRPFYEG